MTTRQQTVDAVVAGIRELAQALARHREGQIGGSDDVTNAQNNLRDALRAVFGMKESAQ